LEPGFSRFSNSDFPAKKFGFIDFQTRSSQRFKFGFLNFLHILFLIFQIIFLPNQQQARAQPR